MSPANIIDNRKLAALQTEMNKKVGAPANREKVDALTVELEAKNKYIEELFAENETLKKENAELKDSVQFQKYLVEEKVDSIKKEQQRVKDIQNSSKGQNAVIDQLKVGLMNMASIHD
jgi:regulator of replication initiation timing